jgi:hypothetical protein
MPKYCSREATCLAIFQVTSSLSPDTRELSTKVSTSPATLSIAKFHFITRGRVGWRFLVLAITSRRKVYQARAIRTSWSLQIEHILPQKYEKVPEWKPTWMEEAGETCLHCLENLAWLKNANGKIGNGPFKMEQKNFFGSPTYPLTSYIVKHEDWTEKLVQHNHDNIFTLVKEAWELL